MLGREELIDLRLIDDMVFFHHLDQCTIMYTINAERLTPSDNISIDVVDFSLFASFDILQHRTSIVGINFGHIRHKPFQSIGRKP